MIVPGQILPWAHARGRAEAGPISPDDEPLENEMLVNRAFTVSQTGDGPWFGSGYGPDQFHRLMPAGFSAERIELPPDQSAYPPGTGHALRITRTAAGAGTFAFIVEGAQTMAGQRLVASLHGRTSAGAPVPVQLDWIQDYGTGGGGGAAPVTTALAGFAAIGSAVERLSGAADLPVLSGAFGANRDHHARLRLTVPADSLDLGDFIEIAAAQIDRDMLKPYRVPDPVLEYQRCLRFHFFVATGFSGAGNNGAGGSPDHQPVYFPVEMRRIPDVRIGPATSAVQAGPIITHVTRTSALLSVYATAGLGTFWYEGADLELDARYAQQA